MPTNPEVKEPTQQECDHVREFVAFYAATEVEIRPLLHAATLICRRCKIEVSADQWDQMIIETPLPAPAPSPVETARHCTVPIGPWIGTETHRQQQVCGNDMPCADHQPVETPRQKAHRLIQEKQQLIERTQSEINDIAAMHIPQFHFLDHKVSTFWECNKSPIGWCVWDIRERGFHADVCCYYCGGPVERK